jgi:hypothetical protein
MSSSCGEKQASGHDPHHIEIAGKRIELRNTSGRSALPPVAAVAPIRTDPAHVCEGAEPGRTSGQSSVPVVAAQPATRVR